MIFDLQRFGGGKGGVTYQTASYEPTVHELRLQELQVGFVEGIMPNANDLNTAAKTLLLGSIGEQPLDFAAHLNEAHTRYNRAYEALFAGAEWISSYLAEIDNHKDDFATANHTFVESLVEPWESTNYTDENGNKKQWVGFADFAAHIIYDIADNGLNEIGDTLKTVVNAATKHYRDVVHDFNEAFNQTANFYLNIVDTEKKDEYETFESTATLNANYLDKLGKNIDDSTQIYITASNELPYFIENAAETINAALKDEGTIVTVAAKINDVDLDELIPKFEVTGDIIDSLIADAVDDLKKVRDINYEDLDDLPTKLDSVESDVKVTLTGYIGDIKPVKVWKLRHFERNC